MEVTKALPFTWLRYMHSLQMLTMNLKLQVSQSKTKIPMVFMKLRAVYEHPSLTKMRPSVMLVRTLTMLIAISANVYSASGEEVGCPADANYDCSCKDEVIDCVGKSLFTIPRLTKGDFPQTKLDMSNNPLQYIYKTLFPNGIKDFRCDRCHNLREIEEGGFTGSEETIETIHISESPLTQLPPGLNQLTKLKDLCWLSGKLNDPTHTGEAMKHHKNTLQKLALYNNQLKEIPDLREMNKLYYIFLDNNGITDPETILLPTACGELELGWNSLTRIPAQQLSGLNQLFGLHLQNNKIKAINTSALPKSMNTLILHHNEITNIVAGNFQDNMKNIYRLDLSDNPITSISENAFSNLTKLTNLDISNTQITSLYQTLTKLTELKTLKLKNTRLTRLPLSLKSLKKLTSLDLSNNPELVCTCSEQELANWYPNVTIDIVGKCKYGKDITYFLFYVASYCDVAPVCKIDTVGDDKKCAAGTLVYDPISLFAAICVSVYTTIAFWKVLF